MRIAIAQLPPFDGTHVYAKSLRRNQSFARYKEHYQHLILAISTVPTLWLTLDRQSTAWSGVHKEGTNGSVRHCSIRDQCPHRGYAGQDEGKDRLRKLDLQKGNS